MRGISRAADGYLERAYAKWIVLNFAWQSLEPRCRRRSYATASREACERNVHVILTPLRQTLDRVFAAAPCFYRLNRGAEPAAIDASTFCKRRNLDKGFAILRRGSQNDDCLTAVSRLGFTCVPHFCGRLSRWGDSRHPCATYCCLAVGGVFV